MYLQDHAGLESGFGQGFRQADHCQFDDIGSCALDRGVDGFALFTLADGVVGSGSQRREVTPASEQRFHVTLAAGLKTGVIEPFFDPREFPEIFLDEILGFSQGQISGTGETEGAHAVDQTKVDRLGMPALLLGNFVQGHVFYGGCGGSMNILGFVESFHHGFVLCQVGNDA